MRNTRPAIRYSKAILSLAKDNNKETEVSSDMLLIASTITENKELEVMLKSPVIKAIYKKEVLDKLFTDRVSNITLGLFLLLRENKRLGLLQEVAEQYNFIYDYLKSIETAKVTTAVPLTSNLEKDILAKIVELTGNKATIENVVKPDIIGGFILRVGDVQYDASISNHLKELRKEFDHSHYIPKI